MISMKTLVVLLGLVITAALRATNIDSLVQKLKVQKDDTAKAILFTDISKYYAERGEFENAISYSEKGIQYCKQQEEKTIEKEKQVYLRCESRIANNAGLIRLSQGVPAEAIRFMRLSLDLKKQLGDKKSIAYTYLNIGNILMELGSYAEALENTLACLKLSREIQDSMGICYALNNVGLYYLKTGNNDEAIKNYKASLEIAKTINNVKAITQLQTNIGSIYQQNGNPLEALKLYENSVTLYQQINDKIGIANVYSRIAEAYASMGDYQKNLEYESRSFSIYEETQHQYQSMSCVNLGLIHMKLKETANAQKWFERGLRLALNSRLKEVISAAYAGLSSADSAAGRWNSAFENYKLFIQYRDSIKNEENTKKQTQVEMDRKESATKAEQAKKDAIAASEKRKQQIILYSVMSGFVLVLAASFFLFRAYRQKQFANKRIIKQKEIIEEKQAEILDSIYYAKRIQQSLLPTEKYITRIIQKLKS